MQQYFAQKGWEGTLNYHPQRPMQVFKRLNLVGRFGVTTGRSYCGVGGLSVKGTGGT